MNQKEARERHREMGSRIEEIASITDLATLQSRYTSLMQELTSQEQVKFAAELTALREKITGSS